LTNVVAISVGAGHNLALKTDGTVVALIKKGVLAEEAGEGEKVEIILDKTPLYGESGGQVGDHGVIVADGSKAEVLDTKRFSDILIHNAVVRKGVIRKEMAVSATVDEDIRKSVMRNHTATHLLHSALRAILGDHIKQAGSLVAPDRLRFDFTHFYAMQSKEIDEVEEIVNEKILENLPVRTSTTTLDDAISQGVTALFGEKYGDKVRVIRTGDFSAELCGGTHCHATGEIGLFKIVSEGSVAAGIRRIEAVTGLPAIEFYKTRENELKRTAALLKVPEQKVSERVEKMITEVKQQEKDLDKLRQKAVKGKVDAILERTISVEGINVLAQNIDGLEMKALRDLSDALRNKMGSGIILLASALNGQAYYVSAVSKDLTPRFHAGEILKTVTGGKGGGRPDMAQGGTKDVEGINRALGLVVEIVKERVGAGQPRPYNK
jgi:alanyl-tRNA synthetase